MSHKINPKKHRVKSYTRKDNTVVKSHLKTYPNNIKEDNIRHK